MMLKKDNLEETSVVVISCILIAGTVVLAVWMAMWMGSTILEKMAVIAVVGGVPIAITTIGAMWGVRWLYQEVITETARVNQRQKAGWLWGAKWWVAAVVVVVTAFSAAFYSEQETGLRTGSARSPEIVEGSRKEYGDWYYAEYLDKATNKKMPITVSFDREAKGAFVQVFCNREYLLIGINFGQKLVQNSRYHAISYRFDEAQTVTENWYVISLEDGLQLLQRGGLGEGTYDKKTHFYETAMWGLDLSEYDRLSVNTHSFEGVLLQRTFSLRGSHEPVLRVMHSCGYGE